MSTRICGARSSVIALTLLTLVFGGSRIEAMAAPIEQEKPKIIVDPKARAVLEVAAKTYSALKAYSCVCYSQSVHTGINSSMTRAVSQIRWKPGEIAVSRRSHTTAFFKWERSQTV